MQLFPVVLPSLVRYDDSDSDVVLKIPRMGRRDAQELTKRDLVRTAVFRMRWEVRFSSSNAETEGASRAIQKLQKQPPIDDALEANERRKITPWLVSRVDPHRSQKDGGRRLERQARFLERHVEWAAWLSSS
jgi:hypothetical protein